MATGPASGRLSEQDIESIAAALRRGEYLNEGLQPLLFNQAKEYELVYAGKTRETAVLSDTMAVPLQTLRTVGPVSDGVWHNKLIFGDNLQILRTLLDMKAAGQLKNADGSDGIRVCYIDPPFATKQEFRGDRGQRAYKDKIAGAAFVEFLRKRLILIRELLADNGMLWLHLDTRKSHYMKVVLDEIFGEHNFRNEVAWKRTSAHADAAVMGAVHETLLVYSKSSNIVWNQQYVPYEDWYVKQYYRYMDGDRPFMSGDLGAAGLSGGGYDYVWNGHRRVWRVPEKTMKRLDSEGRVFYTRNGMPRLKRFLDESKGMPLSDLWSDIQPVVSWSDERTDYPTQKPKALVRRVIEAASDPGDLVMDVFAGSGTTAVVAEETGRRWIVADAGKLAVYTTQKRLLGLDLDGETPIRPFEFCSAGLYDNNLLEGLDFGGFRDFCLQLFGCRPDEHRISNIVMSGRRRNDPVHFFPYATTDAAMGRAYIESLHERLKRRHSGAVYVVAPVSACDPGLFEDVITLDSNTYFILRVPYSVIEAIHGKKFELHDQPVSEEDLNDPVDAFGFDFMQLPAVDADISVDDNKLTVVINSFSSGGLDPDDLPTLPVQGRLELAVVMADLDYRADENFRLSEFWFGDVLERSKWSFEVPRDSCGANVLLIFVDIHGNERRESIALPPTNKVIGSKQTATRATRIGDNNGAKAAPRKARSAAPDRATKVAPAKAAKAAPVKVTQGAPAAAKAAPRKAKATMAKATEVSATRSRRKAAAP